MGTIERINDTIVDRLEVAISDLPPIECTLVHRFTPGLYIRELTMPKGALITSQIHNTCHPFTISQGIAQVSIDGQDWEQFEAPYTGITKPGTRRVLLILEKCIWTTFHPLPHITGEENEYNPEQIEDVVNGIGEMIIEKHKNKLLTTENKRGLQ